jgi:hypothetical protein
MQIIWWFVLMFAAQEGRRVSWKDVALAIVLLLVFVYYTGR